MLDRREGWGGKDKLVWVHAMHRLYWLIDYFCSTQTWLVKRSWNQSNHQNYKIDWERYHFWVAKSRIPERVGTFMSKSMSSLRGVTISMHFHQKRSIRKYVKYVIPDSCRYVICKYVKYVFINKSVQKSAPQVFNTFGTLLVHFLHTCWSFLCFIQAKT